MWPGIDLQDKAKARFELLLKLLMNQVFIFGKTLPLIEYKEKKEDIQRELWSEVSFHLMKDLIFH